MHTDTTGRSRAVIIVAVVAVGLLGFVAFKVFGSDDGGDETGRIARGAARYCQLADQFDSLAVTTGTSSSPGVFNGPASAVASLSDGMGETLGEMATVAPDPIRAAVVSLVAAIGSAAGGDTASLASPTLATDVASITTYRQQNCGLMSSGDGGASGEG